MLSVEHRRKYLPEHCDPYVDEMGLTDIDTLPGILADTVADLEGGIDLVFAYIEAVDAAGHKYGPGRDHSYHIYRVTHLVGNNLLLTWLRQLWQQVGHYCSYLLPRQDGEKSKI